MGRIALGVVLAGVAAFFWGFLYFGASPVAYSSWLQVADDEAAGKVLLEHFPQRGIYSVPNMSMDQARMEALTAAGPVARVYMLHPEGRAMMAPSMMVMGWLHGTLVAGILALLILAAGPSLPTYARRVRFVAMIALASAVLSELGDAIWWETPLTWAIVTAFYQFSVIVIMGLVLAKFVVATPAPAAKSEDAAA